MKHRAHLMARFDERKHLQINKKSLVYIRASIKPPAGLSLGVRGLLCARNVIVSERVEWVQSCDDFIHPISRDFFPSTFAHLCQRDEYGEASLMTIAKKHSDSITEKITLVFNS